jgi:hypothetical protein
MTEFWKITQKMLYEMLDWSADIVILLTLNDYHLHLQAWDYKSVGTNQYWNGYSLLVIYDSH